MAVGFPWPSTQSGSPRGTGPGLEGSLGQIPKGLPYSSSLQTLALAPAGFTPGSPGTRNCPVGLSAQCKCQEKGQHEDAPSAHTRDRAPCAEDLAMEPPSLEGADLEGKPPTGEFKKMMRRGSGAGAAAGQRVGRQIGRRAGATLGAEDPPAPLLPLCSFWDFVASAGEGRPSGPLLCSRQTGRHQWEGTVFGHFAPSPSHKGNLQTATATKNLGARGKGVQPQVLPPTPPPSQELQCWLHTMQWQSAGWPSRAPATWTPGCRVGRRAAPKQE